MKLSMFPGLPLALTLALALPPFPGFGLSTLRAQENRKTAPSGNIQVQTTVFKVTGPDLPLSLLHEAPDSDEALFIRLAGMVGDGGAELIADQHNTIPASTGAEVFRSQNLESIKETPFPSEYTVQRGGLEMVPEFFEYKNCGLAMGAEFKLLPRNPGNPASSGVLGPLSVENIRGDRIGSWPVSLPSVSATGSLDSPQFLTEKTHLIFKSTDARHHLISMVRRAGETLGKNDDYCLTFAKAAPETGKSASLPRGGTALRLHALTFRLPTADGRPLLELRRQSGDDRALLDSLLRASATGKAALHDHSILRVEPSQEPPAPKSSDPFASVNTPTTASLDTIEEFMYPTEYGDFLTPESFEFKNLGRTFEVTADKTGASGQTRLHIRLQSYAVPELFSWPEAPENGKPDAQVYYPAFPFLKLSAMLSVRPGGAYCLGAVTLPSFSEDQHPEQSVIQISLLKVLGESGDSRAQPESAASAQPELSSEMISLTPGDAANVKTLRDSPGEAKALLARLTEDGTAHSLAYLQIAGDAASRPEILAGVETPFPFGSLRTATGLLLPTRIEYYTLSNSLAFLPAHEPGKADLKLRITHTNATVIQPTLIQLEKAAAGDGAVPPPELFVNEAQAPFSPGPFQILIAEPAKVPSGHPEQGRWHVTVLRCTAQ